MVIRFKTVFPCDKFVGDSDSELVFVSAFVSTTVQLFIFFLFFILLSPSMRCIISQCDNSHVAFYDSNLFSISTFDVKRLGVDKIDNSQDFVSLLFLSSSFWFVDGAWIQLDWTVGKRQGMRAWHVSTDRNSHTDLSSTHSHPLLIHCRHIGTENLAWQMASYCNWKMKRKSHVKALRCVCLMEISRVKLAKGVIALPVPNL